MKTDRTRLKKGFSLVEVLVVLIVIASLSTLVFLTKQEWKQAEERAMQREKIRIEEEQRNVLALREVPNR
jgi:prepilin-type N-terminal cleavage/methylation domain-containing protein